MGEQADMAREDYREEEIEEPQWVECFICGERYLDDGEYRCCMIDV